MSTLAIHPGPVGDVLLAVPALRALKAKSPTELLRLAAQPGVGSLLAALGAVDRAVSFDGLRLDTLFVEDESPTTRDAVRGARRIVCWFGSRDPVFTRRLRALAPDVVVASPTGDGAIPVWGHLLATVEARPGASLHVCDPSPAAREAGRQALVRAGWRVDTRLVIVHPGAGSVGKRWPPEGFAQVLAPLYDRPDVVVVLHQGPADADAVTAVVSRLGERALVLRDLGLVELAGALVQAAAYLGNDSGISHLAATLGLPSVILFEERSVAWRPWSASADVVVVDTASVRHAELEAIAARLARLLA